MFTSRHPSPFFRESVAVIGAGMAGLSIAFRLAQQGHRVTVFEAETQPGGGCMSGFDIAGRPAARFPQWFRRSDVAVLGLLRELGLDGEVKWTPRRSAQWENGRLYTRDRWQDLLKFQPLGFAGRCRALSTVPRARLASARGLDGVTAAAWLTALGGDIVFRTWWLPRLVAEYGDAWAQVPALALWTALHTAGEDGSRMQGHLRGGGRTLAFALMERLGSMGSQVRLNARVQCVDLDERNRPLVLTAAGVEKYHQVVLALPGPSLAGVTGPRMRKRMPALPADYTGLLSAVVMLKKPVLTGIHSVFTPGDDCPFDHIQSGDAQDGVDGGGRGQWLYLTRYAHRSSADYQRSEPDIRAAWLGALGRMFPDAGGENFSGFRLFRHACARPLLRCGFLATRLPEALISGCIYHTSSAQGYPGAATWNTDVEQAGRTLQAMEYARQLHAPGTTPFTLPH